LCTRFATELILRRSLTSSVEVSIIAGPYRSDAEKKELGIPVCTADSMDIGELVEHAEVVMGLIGSRRVVVRILSQLYNDQDTVIEAGDNLAAVSREGSLVCWNEASLRMKF
jgi:hypothetical protein